MRKVSPGIVRYAFLSAIVVLILGACMKPVSVKPFLEDDKVEDIVRGNTGVGVDFGFENPADIPPVLQASIGGTLSPLVADGMVTVSLGSLGGVTITVTNATAYDTIEWYYNSNRVATGTIFSLGSVFNAAETYPVTVIGKKGALLYSMLFYVNVGS